MSTKIAPHDAPNNDTNDNVDEAPPIDSGEVDSGRAEGNAAEDSDDYDSDASLNSVQRAKKMEELTKMYEEQDGLRAEKEKEKELERAQRRFDRYGDNEPTLKKYQEETEGEREERKDQERKRYKRKKKKKEKEAKVRERLEGKGSEQRETKTRDSERG